MDAPQVRYARAEDDVEIAYAVAGSGPPLLVVDSLLWQADMRFDARLAPLVEVATVIAYDPRNTGLSGDSTRVGLDDYLSDIDAVLSALGIEVVALRGRVAPSQIALAYAATRARRVARLILVHPLPPGASPRTAPSIQEFGGVASTSWDLFAELLALKLLAWRDIERARILYENLRSRWNGEKWHRVMASFESLDASELLGAIRAPTLIISSRDPAASNSYDPDADEYCRHLAAAIRHAQLALVDDSDDTNFGSPSLAIEFLQAAEGDMPGDDGGVLTRREHEILELIASGHDNGAMAQRLTLSARTVERHVHNIYTKLGVHNRVEAANWAREHGMRP
ncbi:MAG: alpha/beta fold hydrolase [Dehalococcoidia bacterium]|nr:alpha/beta fold hydrolase [Dehalococcoidia bacterium]